MNPAPPVTKAVFPWIATRLTRRSNPGPEGLETVLTLTVTHASLSRVWRYRRPRRGKSYLPIGDIASSMLTEVGSVVQV